MEGFDYSDENVTATVELVPTTTRLGGATSSVVDLDEGNDTTATSGLHNRHGCHDHDHQDSNDYGAISPVQSITTTHNNDNDEDQSNTNNKLSYYPLLAIIFYTVSGGPYGIESTVRAGGNFYALLGFLIGPIIWSLPEALMTAELSTTFPHASAGVIWISEAFKNDDTDTNTNNESDDNSNRNGKLAGWIFGYLSWISGATDVSKFFFIYGGCKTNF